MGREYNSESDKKAARRIWIESGWIEDEKKDLEQFDIFLEAATAIVSDMDGEAECLVTTVPGDYLHENTHLPYTAVTSVNTGRIGRKQGLASVLLAEALSTAAISGSVAAGLGIFEQGFYDRLGFGSTTYERWITFDPATLVDFGHFPAPSRIGIDDYAAVHACLCDRLRRHGSVNLFAEGHTRAGMMWGKHGFGLGYRSSDDIDSLLWFGADNAESGPYSANICAWKQWTDIPKTLSILKNLSDQVHIVQIREPAYLQVQDYLTRPLRTRSMSRGAKHEQRSSAVSYHQIRILDLAKAIAAIHIPDGEISFNLTIHDPIEQYLADDLPWRGCGGDFTVTLGESSTCEQGHSAGAPLLVGDINTFSRLWCGALSSSALAINGDIDGPESLLEKLDKGLRFSSPLPDWDY
jgi:predicted acetyltransferase